MSHKMTELDAEHAHYAETPWHKLGTVGHIWPYEAETMFNWAEVEKCPLYIKDIFENTRDEKAAELAAANDDDAAFDASYKEYVALGNRQVLQMVEPSYRHIAHAEVTDRYQIVQHSFMTDTIVPILLDTGMVERIESLGTYNNGEVGYVSLKFTNNIEIPGWSTVESMFNIGNGHDKKIPLLATQSARAVVCANTFQWNVLDKTPVYKFRKMGKPAEMMEEAVRALADGFNRQETYKRNIERLSNEEYSNTQWRHLKQQLMPEPHANAGDSMNTITRWINNTEALDFRFHIDADIAGVRNTKWGALMAVQAWEQKDKTIKGDKHKRQSTHQANVMFGKLPMTNKAAELLSI